MATALLGAIFVCLGGYSVISNAILRDVRSRCGSVIASTTVRNGEYIIGKFLGNILFLGTFFAGFMLVSMAMVLVRGEAPLEVGTFLLQYLLIAPPPIVFASVLAIVFESIPFLSGRFGDVVYFFLFLGLLGAAVATAETTGATWPAYFDPSGMAPVILQTTAALHTKSIAIGAGPFDRHLPPVVYPGLPASGELFAERLLALIVPLPLLLIARLSFHRFDPARVRASASQKRRWFSRLNAIGKPLTRRMLALARSPVAADALMTATLTPVVVLLAIASLIAGTKSVATAFVLTGLAIADVASRDFQQETVALIYAAPRLREHFVAWKFLSSLCVAVVMLATAMLHAPIAAVLSGLLFMTSAATLLAIVTRNAKAFIVLFLSFWYVVVSDRGHTPALDFAGLFGRPPASVTLMYAVMAVALFVAAEGVYRWRLAR
ncbi:MAG TPA: hypothetical protein VL284_16530 [Thermoanaerobaculia bacterium]|nr:hypothetical protein [Thermoanaerobaculia bacterium]